MRDEALRREIARVHEDNYSVLGARKMHVMRGRPEIAERHGAGHVARCTVERLMGDLGLHGIRRAKSPCTTRSAPREQCPADLVRRHFEAFAPNELWVADIPPQAGGTPSYVRTFSGWVYVAFVTDVYSRRIIGWQTTCRLVCTDLALDTLKMTVWQRRREGAGLTGLVHHLRPRRVSTEPSAMGRPYQSVMPSPRWVPRGTPFGFTLAEALNSLCKAELIRNQGPWEDIDAARARHRRVGSLVRAPSGLTPPSACTPPPSTKPPGHPTATARNNPSRKPPAPDKPASTKPRAWGVTRKGAGAGGGRPARRHRALAVAVAQDMGITVGYLPGLSMRRIADLTPGSAKIDAKDAAVIAQVARTIPHTLRAITTSDEDAVALPILTVFDPDMARQVKLPIGGGLTASPSLRRV